MQLLRESNDSIFRLSVLGVIETKEHITLIADELTSCVLKIELYLYDQKIVPYEMLKLLFILKSKKLIARINAFRYQLYSYLVSFDFPVYFITPILKVEPDKKKFSAIAIGGSADSLDKILKFVEKIPTVNIPIFIVQHVQSKTKNMLSELISKKDHHHTIVEAEDGVDIQQNTIYIAPSGKHMVVEQNKIRLLGTSPVNFAKPSIDVLFDTASREYKDKLCCVLLCGYGSDGCHSLKELISRGTTVVIENPSDCNANALLVNAIKENAFDCILKINEIVDYISGTLSNFTIDSYSEVDLAAFLDSIKDRYGYDYGGYQLASIRRRIKLIMTKESIRSLKELEDSVLNNPALFEKLFLEFSINVSHFFRNPEVFKFMHDEIFPYLNSFSHLKFWSAGCSSGEEPYSLAILLNSSGLLNKSLIYSTDINPYIVSQAQNGIYNEKKLATLKKNFSAVDSVDSLKDSLIVDTNFFEIKQNIKEKILFFQHSLVNSGVFNEFQMILCRNVLIYFNDELKEKILNLFADSLDREGFLILGESENISMNGNSRFEVVNRDLRIYRLKRY